MDTGRGQFVTGNDFGELIANAEKFGVTKDEATRKLEAEEGVFHVGETMTIKGSLFRVNRIHGNELTLGLLPAN